MKPIKEILVSLTKSYQDKVEEAKKLAEKMVRTAETARAAAQGEGKKAESPPPKK